MARIRSIHPDACKSEKLAAVSGDAERLYWRLSTHCDDEGRAEDDPRIFAAYLFPLRSDITEREVEPWLDELATVGLVVRYKVDARAYLQVVRWEDYQKPQRPSPSRIPPLTEDSASNPRGLSLGVEVGGGEGDASPRRATRAPATFVVTDAMRAWAEGKEVSAVDEQTERFLDYHRAKGSSFKDWTAAWRTWMSRSKEYAPSNGSETVYK